MARTRTGHRGRGRRRLGAALIVLGAVLGVAFVASARWWFGYSTRRWVADLGDGTLYRQTIGPDPWREPLVGWHAGDNTRFTSTGPGRSWTWTWWTWGERPAGWTPGHAYTVWPLSPILVIAGAAFFWPGYRSARRRARGQCPTCGYSRAGLREESACPECGETTSGSGPPGAAASGGEGPTSS